MHEGWQDGQMTPTPISGRLTIWKRAYTWPMEPAVHSGSCLTAVGCLLLPMLAPCGSQS